MKFTAKALSVSALALAMFASSMTVAPMLASNAPGSKANEPAYNPAAMVDMQGTITAVRQVPAGSPLEGVHLTLKSKASTIDVYLAPADFLKIFKINFPVGYEIRVLGSKVSFANSDMILANEVNIGVTSIILRDGSGAPVWQNWGVEI
jgi:hypothetical protein